MEKRKTRSSAYQWILVEKAFSHDMMETFSNDDGIHKKLNPFEYDEEILILEDQLKERFWEIIEEHLTDRQLEIVNLLKQGLTQSETADKLGVNQSSITKCVSKDTVLYFAYNKRHTILDVYSNWGNGKFETLPILCMDEDAKKIIETTITNVIRGTEKEMFRIVSDSGKIIKTSIDHQFFTNNGWLRLEDILSKNAMITVYDGENIKFEKIKDWSSVGIEISYDIEVESKWHNFIGNEIIIHNSINGNKEYSNKKNTTNKNTSYGGVVRKVRRVMDSDPKIKEIMDKIAEIRNNSWV